MENDTESLQQSIKQYETQLLQIKQAICSATTVEEKKDLFSLEKDIKELISLTKETLSSVQHPTENVSNLKSEDPFSQEYANFKAELAELEDISTSENAGSQEKEDVAGTDDSSQELQNELVALKGTKCQAPYSQHWQRADTSRGQSYHNALIVDVETSQHVHNLSHIQVRVLFVNPTEKCMLPCPFYLDGECRFSDEKCNYSHGELVAFSDIKEYREPDFSQVQEGTIVLAKQKDSLWHRARVKDIIDDGKVRVQFETKAHETVDMDLHDVLPLSGEREDEDTSSGSSSDSSDSDSDSSDEGETDIPPQEFFVNMSLTRSPPSTKLGEWEKHTKGIGSRLMANMGYVVGCGLGKRGEGRLEPVEATAYPPGKSLDACMALREAAGGDPDMFKAERRQRKQQQKLIRMQQRLKERDSQRTDVFTFLNNKLAGATSAKLKASHQILASTSSKGLNVERFQLAENIRKKQKDIEKLKQSLKRHESGSLAHKAITSKLREAQSELGVLQNNDKMIATEQDQRDDRKKMAVF